MQLPQIVELKGIRVLTSKQLAECYESTPVRIKQNFKENRNRYIEGKHYISLTGDDLKKFKKQVGNSYLVANQASHLYLWTEKGALLHAKSLNTDKAWEVYDYLVDFYFRAREIQNLQERKEPEPDHKDLVVDVPENADVQKAMKRVQDRLTTISVLTENMNAYQREETYDKLSDTLGTMWLDLGKSITKLMDTSPNLIKSNEESCIKK